MHKNLWLPGFTEIPLVRTVRDPVADRRQVPCWHLLFRIGVTETDRFNRCHADLPRPLGRLSAVYILIWTEQSLSLGRFNLSQADRPHVLCGLFADALFSVQPLPERAVRCFWADRPPYMNILCRASDGNFNLL